MVCNRDMSIEPLQMLIPNCLLRLGTVVRLSAGDLNLVIFLVFIHSLGFSPHLAVCEQLNVFSEKKKDCDKERANS
jgi:hypothetical protein